MGEYRISGVWKSGNVITHYAVHTRTRNADNTGYVLGQAVKMTKASTVALLDQPNNSAKTYLWSYQTALWSAGSDIHVVDGNPKFLRTNHDGVLKDNLSHLPDYSWVW
ncbi:hypothetical protein [Flavobacterium sp.]|uniref:hypothetical protein n=1 Tax=Flavobacterium sp. TaxID=239 RepID=UPI0039E26455